MPCRASGVPMAKRDRMDGAKRSQSDLDRSSLRAERPCLIGTALYGAVRRVVWDPWLAGLALSQSRGPDSQFIGVEIRIQGDVDCDGQL